MYKEIDLSHFPAERQAKLESIYRYNYFDVLFYRSNLWTHSQRVLWLLEELAPIAQKYIKFDLEKARAFALVHDDAEIITGDVQAITKLRMSVNEQAKHEEEEMVAIDKLAEIYPKEIHGYSYKELLQSAAKKNSIESKLVSYLDKLDAYCESLHEVYAGNISLLRSVVFYANALPLFPIKYPELKDLLSSKESPLTFLNDQISPGEIRVERYANLGKPHTRESLENDVDFPFYKAWKKIIIERGKIDWLLNQKEYLPKKD